MWDELWTAQRMTDPVQMAPQPALLFEDGVYLLLESGDFLLLE